MSSHPGPLSECPREPGGERQDFILVSSNLTALDRI